MDVELSVCVCVYVCMFVCVCVHIRQTCETQDYYFDVTLNFSYKDVKMCIIHHDETNHTNLIFCVCIISL